MEESYKALYAKFMEVKKLGLFTINTNNPGEIGLNFEKLICSSGGDFNVPDFEGIEIKCIKRSATNGICLFSSSPYGSVPFPILKMSEKYGYPDKLYKNKKVLSTFSYVNKNYKFGLFNSTKLMVDYTNKIIKLLILNYYGKILDDSIYWTFSELEEKLVRKAKSLAIVEYSKFKYNQKQYYGYDNLNYYTLRGFEYFIFLLQHDIVYITIDVGVVKSGKNVGAIKDHGTSFKINYNNLYLLYEKKNYINNKNSFFPE